ncbi:MAG: hypothetical protein ABIR15_00265 [Chitinophagaceae bacterium]
MKKIIYLIVLVLTHGIIFSQQKLNNGIYLVDQSVNSRHAVSQPNRAVVLFNPGFVNEDPENYEPLVIITDDYFSFEMAGQPVVQNKRKENGALLLQLTADAKEKLKKFTSRNLMKNIVVVVNDEALVIYKITTPVISGLIKITKCDGQACNQIFKRLKSSSKI